MEKMNAHLRWEEGGGPKQTELVVVQNGFLEEVSLGISRQLTSFIKINNIYLSPNTSDTPCLLSHGSTVAS